MHLRAQKLPLFLSLRCDKMDFTARTCVILIPPSHERKLSLIGFAARLRRSFLAGSNRGAAFYSRNLYAQSVVGREARIISADYSRFIFSDFQSVLIPGSFESC